MRLPSGAQHCLTAAMNDRSHGYDLSVGYTYGFYREMAPGWLDLFAAIGGHAPPRAHNLAPFRYLELGAGQGMGTALLAAANPQGEFVGVDFHPQHAAHANRVAKQAGLANFRFSAADFAELAADWPEDFGTFDYVVLHGVYSWIVPELRAALVECLRHATHPGSLVYVSYNTQPGWLATMPFQHVSRRIAETSGKPGAEVFAEAIGIFDRLQAGGAATFQFLPGLGSRIEQAKQRSANYLVQEYLNQAWQLFWHSEVAGELARAGLAHAGTATAAEPLMPDQLPPQLRAVVVAQEDPGLRQDLQDFVLNQSFRRDIFIRGPGGGRRDFAAAAAVRVALLSPPAPDAATIEVQSTFGEIDLQRPAFAPVVEALGAGPLTIGELAQLPAMQPQGLGGTVQIVLLLLEAGTLAVAAGEPAHAEAEAQRLNRFIARETAAGVHYDYLATPLTGSAAPATDLQLLMLDAWFEAEGAITSAELAHRTVARLDQLGRSLLDANGALAPGAAARLLGEAAGEFLGKTVPRWQALGALP